MDLIRGLDSIILSFRMLPSLNQTTSNHHPENQDEVDGNVIYKYLMQHLSYKNQSLDWSQNFPNNILLFPSCCQTFRKVSLPFQNLDVLNSSCLSSTTNTS